MIRQPFVAGRFYPAQPDALEREVRACLRGAPPRREEHTLLAMAPHAGYVYSGRVAGLTLAQANLSDNLLLLCPNHTGLGASLAVWDKGRWITPTCVMDVDEPLARALLEAEPRLASDAMAHQREHSLEVLLPFLGQVKPGFRGVPLCVAERSLAALSRAAAAMAGVLRALPGGASLVVSSDMSHFENAERAKSLDFMALEAVLRLDPAGLHEVVRAEGITMCGVLPMTLGLMIALELGAKRAELAAYANSGEVTGDFSSVVGYAGVLVS
ncbi:AmmeMemoRadiSam system protein B [Fundidesulfovibrio magnetotacticus]|nr:AmmeMemoRadiSam system protein B [Fundidesulfovibrio magnetotacticus]